eukprot:gene10861-biopygen6545
MSNVFDGDAPSLFTTVLPFKIMLPWNSNEPALNRRSQNGDGKGGGRAVRFVAGGGSPPYRRGEDLLVVYPPTRSVRKLRGKVYKTVAKVAATSCGGYGSSLPALPQRQHSYAISHSYAICDPTRSTRSCAIPQSDSLERKAFEQDTSKWKIFEQ